MSEGTAEVIAAHLSSLACAIHCRATGEDHSTHIAEELAKAGYGRLEGAWDDGRRHGAAWPYGKKGLAVDENPYRKTV